MDEQLYLMGLGLSLEEKVDKAIATFQHYEGEALKFDNDGYWLCDSYGKDSCVILDLAKKAGVKFKAVHNLTTIDPPELIYFGRKHHTETIVIKPDIPLLKIVETVHGLPTRLQRWCCAKYKESANGNSVAMFGVRASESVRRKANWKIWTPHRHGSWIFSPILYWSDENVWQYIHGNNIPYCELYDEGFKRLGCIGCPMAGKGRKEEFKRWPKYEQAWKRSTEKHWNNWKGVPRKDGEPRAIDTMGMKSWEDLWSWWMEDMPKVEIEDDCQMGLF